MYAISVLGEKKKSRKMKFFLDRVRFLDIQLLDVHVGLTP